MKKIELINGKYTLVDDEDYRSLCGYKWRYFANKSGNVYVYTSLNNRTIYMHREIMKTPPNMQVDHRNHNGFDNRKSNLRNCTGGQNNANSIKKPNTSSRWRGICFIKTTKKWMAKIQSNKKVTYIGIFEKEKDAAMAWDKYARKLHGEFARLNFPALI